MSTALAATRVCADHHRALREVGHDRLHCPAGPPGGHYATRWATRDHRGNVLVSADDERAPVQETKRMPLTDPRLQPPPRPASTPAAPAPATPARSGRQKRQVAAAKFEGGAGGFLFLSLERAKSMPFVVRFRTVLPKSDGGHDTHNGIAGFAANEKSATETFEAQRQAAGERGWTEVPIMPGRMARIEEIPMARGRATTAPARRRA